MLFDELRELAQAPEEGSLSPALATWTAAALGELPEVEREALELVDLRGRPRREAAASLGLSYRGLNSRVQRGRRRLRALVEACCAVAVDARGAPMDCAPRVGGACAVGCGGAVS